MCFQSSGMEAVSGTSGVFVLEVTRRKGKKEGAVRTRQGCVDVKHHGRDDFGVHRRRACIGDVVAHVDITPKTRERVRERGGRGAPFELVLENSSFCSNDGNGGRIAISW